MLVQLGVDRVNPKVQPQDALADAANPDWALQQVQQVVHAVRGSSFRAIVNARCQLCTVRTSCPLRDEGRQVTQ
jgi:hypothetical protein